MRGYAYKGFEKEHMARAVGVALPISFKQSVEVCRFIRNRKVSSAKKMLQEVIEKKKAVPFRRFDFDLGHKKETGPGRYPEKTSSELIRLIESAEANAQFKGLHTSNLVIAHISAHKASKAWHYGRHSRRKMKRTNIEVVVQEKAKEETPKETKQTAKGKKE